MSWSMTPEESARHSAYIEHLKAQYAEKDAEWMARHRQNEALRNGGYNSFDERLEDWEKRREAFYSNDDEMTDAQREHFADANSGRSADHFVLASNGATADLRYSQYENVDMATYLKLRASGELK